MPPTICSWRGWLFVGRLIAGVTSASAPAVDSRLVGLHLYVGAAILAFGAFIAWRNMPPSARTP